MRDFIGGLLPAVSAPQASQRGDSVWRRLNLRALRAEKSVRSCEITEIAAQGRSESYGERSISEGVDLSTWRRPQPVLDVLELLISSSAFGHRLIRFLLIDSSSRYM